MSTPHPSRAALDSSVPSPAGVARRGVILFASAPFKFYRARWSTRYGQEREDAYAALHGWMAAGHRRGYLVEREGVDYLVATLRYDVAETGAAETAVDNFCKTYELERITTAFMR